MILANKIISKSYDTNNMHTVGNVQGLLSVNNQQVLRPIKTVKKTRHNRKISNVLKETKKIINQDHFCPVSNVRLYEASLLNFIRVKTTLRKMRHITSMWIVLSHKNFILYLLLKRDRVSVLLSVHLTSKLENFNSTQTLPNLIN